METTHPAIETATVPFAEFDDRAGIAYRDELTAEFLVDYLARTIEPHLLTSMVTVTDRVLFAGPDEFEIVELSDGICYTATGTTVSTSLRQLYINATGMATYNVADRTVTVEVFV